MTLCSESDYCRYEEGLAVEIVLRQATENDVIELATLNKRLDDGLLRKS